MSLVTKEFQPLVEDDISPPALVQFMTMSPAQSAQFNMSVIAAETHRFGQLAIKIDANLHIGIGDSDSVFEEKVRQRQGDGISASFQDLEMQVAVPCDPGTIIAVKPLELGNQLLQAQEIALVKRHQADKASRLDDGFRNELIVLQHRSNIAQRFTPKRYAILVPKW